MSEVHAWKCDQCQVLGDLVTDTAAINFDGEEMMLGEYERPPVGWLEVSVVPPKEHDADDHQAHHFCGADCLVVYFMGRESTDGIPEPFRTMDS